MVLGDDSTPDGCAASRPRPLSADNAAAAYLLVQRRIDTLLRARGDTTDVPIPACPQWTVRQTVAHLCGVAEDVAASQTREAGSEAWTQDQVARLADLDLDEVLDRWSEAARETGELLPQIPKLLAGQLVFDALAHEHDLRGALGQPARRTREPALPVAIGFLLTAHDHTVRRNQLPALVLTTDTGTWTLGDPTRAPGRLAVRLSDFEAIRAMGGRRSIAQILALPWSGDATPLLPMFTTHAFHPPEDDLIE